MSDSLFDRIDLCIEVPAVKFEDITSPANGETAAQIRQRVATDRRSDSKRIPHFSCHKRRGILLHPIETLIYDWHYEP